MGCNLLTESSDYKLSIMKPSVPATSTATATALATTAATATDGVANASPSTVPAAAVLLLRLPATVDVDSLRISTSSNAIKVQYDMQPPLHQTSTTGLTTATIAATSNPGQHNSAIRQGTDDHYHHYDMTWVLPCAMDATNTIALLAPGGGLTVIAGTQQ